MRKAEAVNSFQLGLLMDLNPLVTPNNVVVNALNATLVTKNGNEYVLLNDMGNGRVETAYLPEGYIPMGITELGGIIYVVSYNPLIKKCQIGSFPSPERNITTDEDGDNDQTLSLEDFVTKNVITSTIIKRQISKRILHSGDKYIVGAEPLETNSTYISGLGKDPSNVRLYLATMDSNGRLIDLNALDKYKVGEYYYKIYNGRISSDDLTGINKYRTIVSSPFLIFSSKIAGNIYLVAELLVITTFTVTYRCVGYEDNTYILEFTADTTPDNIYLTYIKLDSFVNSNGKLFLIENLSNGSLYYEREGSETSHLNFLLKVSTEELELDGDTSFIITPCMSFGEYRLLQLNMSINFSLLGTGSVENRVWRYFVEENDIYLVWNLGIYPRDNQTVTSLKLFAFEFNEEIPTLDPARGLDGTPLINITGRESYSGSYSNTREFDDRFRKNTLYFIVILVEYATDEGTYEYVYVKKCLYTNGIFNNEYITSSEKDFDNLNPDLTFKATFSVTDNVTSEPYQYLETLVAPSRIGDQNGIVRGADVITYDGDIELLGHVVFEEDYGGSFLVDNNRVNLSVDNELQKTGTLQVTIKSTDLYYNDPSYILPNPEVLVGKISENVPTNTLDFIDTFDSELKIGSNLLITLNIKGRVFNKVSANSSAKNISVNNYITPIIYNSDTALEYGLYVEEGHFSYGTKLYSYGAHCGGSDNEGSGGSRWYFGTRTISLDTPLGFSTPTTLISKYDDSSGSVLEFTDEIVNTTSIDMSIFPVLMVNVGLGRVRIFTSDGKDQNATNTSYIDFLGTDNKEHFVIGSSNHFMNLWGSSTENGVGGWEKDYTKAGFLPVLIWMKALDDRLYPTNTYIPLSSVKGILLANTTSGPIRNGQYLGDIIGSLLTLLYAKRNITSMNGYSVDKILYYNSLVESWNISFNYSLSNLSSNNLQFYNGSTIYSYLDFLDFGKNFFNVEEDGLPECLKITPKIIDTLTYTYSYNILTSSPSVLTSFLSVSSNALLDSYVMTITGESVKLPNFAILLGELYTIKNGELSQSNSILIRPVSKVEQDTNGNISLELASTDNLLDTSVSRKSFYWDYRNNKLLLSNLVVSTCGDYLLTFLAKYNSGHSPTKNKFPNIKLFKNCNVAK